MSVILRWFYVDGVRFRAYFRKATETQPAELVVAAGDWLATKIASRSRLEEYTEAELARIARSLGAPAGLRPVAAGSNDNAQLVASAPASAN